MCTCRLVRVVVRVPDESSVITRPSPRPRIPAACGRGRPRPHAAGIRGRGEGRVITEDSSGTRTTTRTSRQVHINTGGVKSELTAKDGTDSPDALEIGATWLASAQRTRY